MKKNITRRHVLKGATALAGAAVFAQPLRAATLVPVMALKYE